MRLENYIKLWIFSLVSVLINVLLGVWLYFSYQIDPSTNIEIQESEKRIEILRQEVSKYYEHSKSLQIQKDSVTALLDKKPKERIVIKKIYEDKIDSVVNLPIDSSILLLAKRLSETNLD